MKYLLTCFFCFSTLILCAQSRGNLERDTTIANTYYQEAMDSIEYAKYGDRIVQLLKDAVDIYENYAFSPQLIDIKGAYSYILCTVDEELAKKEAMEAVELAEQYGEEERLGAAYTSLANYYKHKDHDKTLKYADLSLNLVKKPSRFFISAALNKMTILTQLRQHIASEELLVEVQKALSNIKNSSQEHFLTNLYQCIALYYTASRDPKQSTQYAQKALNENKKHKTLSIVDRLELLQNICYNYSELGQKDKAFEYIAKIESLTEDETNNIDGKDSALIYGNIAVFYLNLGEYELANKINQKKIDYFLPLAEEYKPVLAEAYYNQAIGFFETFKYEEAKVNIEKSIEFAGPNTPASIYVVYGNILTCLDNLDLALEIFHKVLTLVSPDFTSEDIKDNPKIHSNYINVKHAAIAASMKGVTLFELAMLTNENRLDLLKQSRESSELSIALFYRFMEENLGYEEAKFTQSFDMILTLESHLETSYEILEKTNLQLDRDLCFSTIERKKSALLVETLSPSLLPKELTIRETELTNQYREYSQKLDLASSDSLTFYQEKLFSLNEEFEEFWKEVSDKYSEKILNFYNAKYVDPSSIQSTLDDETLFISYFFTTKYLYYFLIDKQSQAIKRISINWNSIIPEMEELATLLKNPLLSQKATRDKFIDKSHEMYKKFIAPITEELKGKTRLMIVPEDTQFYIPFEVLLPNNEKKPFHELDYLVKDYEFNYHYSATAYQQLKNKEEIKDASLLAFAPVFNDGSLISESTRSLDFLIDSLYRGIEKDQFVSLPNSKKEIQEITKMFEGDNKTTVLLEKNATKTNLTNKLKNNSYQFVHIATHGLVNFQNPKLSGLACYQSGDNTPGSDLYFANEIQTHDINADLVVLSSCESGIGQLVSGEGLLSLNRSFIYAGAKNVLFSLWKVNDAYTKDLMISFYQSVIQEGDSYTSALRKAKLKMLNKPETASPRYWAPFVLMGE